jgi:hypothetical protein
LCDVWLYAGRVVASQEDRVPASARPTRLRTLLYPAQRPFAIDVTEAGPLLDALVAVELLLKTVSLDDPDVPCYHAYTLPRGGHRVPPFSTSPMAVQLVLNRLDAARCAVEMLELPGGRWACQITPPASFGPPVIRIAATEPLAICLAARVVMRPRAR